MQVYQHEEEQLQALKEWWRQHGSLFLTVVTVTLILSGAWRFWQYRQAGHQQRAAVFYQQLQQQVAQQDIADQLLLSERLLSRYNDTLYAKYAAFEKAETYLLEKDTVTAKAQFNWVIEHAKHTGAKNLARLRLARLLLMEKAPAEALVVLDQIDMSAGRVWLAFVRGQAYAMQKKYDLARQAFTAARQALWSKEEQHLFVWISDMASDRSLLNAMINAQLDQIALDQATTSPT
jgi:predicted negative regulator of RcsB-dependent stress response